MPDIATSWHVESLAKVYCLLETSANGLTQKQATERLQKYGTNCLPQRRATPWWMVLLHQFKSPLIYILLLAALVSVIVGDVKDAVFIGLVLVLNAAIGSFQEWKAEKNTQALQKMLQIKATVIRSAVQVVVSAEQLVPGDVVILESGNRVPADLRLLADHGIEIDESLLTGESLPVHKETAWVADKNSSFADRRNMAYAGSIVTRGRAQGVVVATGKFTSVGQLAVDAMSHTGGKPPLLLRMERFTNVIAIIVLASAMFIVAIGILFRGQSFTEMLLFGIALAVSAIPEGLPVAITVALAVATTRMARRGVIVRHLTAVEGLGSCTYIATDKTGTLTCNELTVREIRLVSGTVAQATGEGFTPIGQVHFINNQSTLDQRAGLNDLLRASLLCNEAALYQQADHWCWNGDAVDIALLCAAQKWGIHPDEVRHAFPVVNQIPFEPENQFAASYHRFGDQILVTAKGAPEKILSMCQLELKEESLKQLDAIASEMAEKGFRVLAIAHNTLNILPENVRADAMPPLQFLGFVGMIDPLRVGVREAIHDCRVSGIQVSMVTGDHRITAMAIAKELGLASLPDQVMTGQELAHLPKEQWQEILKRVRVFARVSPQQKLQIVNAARATGHYVAVTGDGVNDAPALREANIGVAMGKSGTDVAREASELIISDDHFATIISGIEEGRVAYDNIRKVIYLLISTGAAEVVLMALVIVSGIPYLPLLPAQILWLNLVTNGIQDIALAFEPNEGGVLHRRPRPPQEGVFNRIMIERTLIAAIYIGVVCFVTFKCLLPANATQEDVSSARNIVLLLLVLFEIFHIGNCRSETKSAFNIAPWRSPILTFGTICAFLIHVAAMHTSWGNYFLGTSSMSAYWWLVMILLAFTILPIMELHKIIWRRRYPSRH